MAILHTQSPDQALDSNGNLITISPVDHLQRFGPLVQVTLSLPSTVANQLLQTGQVLPAPLSGMALIDTGASHTCIDEAIAQQLGLPVVNIVQVASASHASTTQNVYPVGIEVSAIGWRIDSPSVIGAPLAVQGIVLLIGRDILKLCTLIYNGFTGHITLAI